MVRPLIVASVLLLCACGDSVGVERTTGSIGPDSSGGPDSASDTGAASSEPTTGATTEGTSQPPTTGDTTTADSTETGEPAANCYDGDVWVDDAAEGAARIAGYNCIAGTVRIKAGSGPDLAWMGEIRSISGYLHIYEPHEIVSLHGLERLESIGEYLRIDKTVDLTDVSALARLESIGGDLEISFAPQLKALELPALKTVGGNLRITAHALATLDLTGLTSVPGHVEIDGTQLVGLAGLANLGSAEHLHLENNAALVDLTGLAALKSLKTLRLAGNTKLVDLSGLAGLTGLEGLGVLDNATLVSLDGLAPPTTLTELFLQGNASLTDLGALASLKSAGEMEVSKNPKLTSLAPLAGVTVTRLAIHGNAGLEQLAPFVGPVGDLYVTGNPALTSLAGLEDITVQHTLEIADNDALVDLQGLGGTVADVDSVKISGNAGLLTLDGSKGPVGASSVRIEDNPKLASLALLADLETANELIVSQTAVPDVADLAALTAIDNYLGLLDNPSLVALTGLEDLAEVDTLDIRGNPALTSVAALQAGALAQVGGYYGIADNPLLATCAAKAVFDALPQPPEYYCYLNQADACSGPESCNPVPMP